MKLFEALTYFRKQKRMTFDELVAKTNIPKSTLQKVFTGVTADPGFELVRKIAQGLDISVDDLAEATRGYRLESAYSPAALEIARKYDAMDEHGKAVVEAVVDLEAERKPDYASEVERFNAMAERDLASIESSSSKRLG